MDRWVREYPVDFVEEARKTALCILYTSQRILNTVVEKCKEKLPKLDIYTLNLKGRG